MIAEYLGLFCFILVVLLVGIKLYNLSLMGTIYKGRHAYTTLIGIIFLTGIFWICFFSLIGTNTTFNDGYETITSQTNSYILLQGLSTWLNILTPIAVLVTIMETGVYLYQLLQSKKKQRFKLQFRNK